MPARERVHAMCSHGSESRTSASRFPEREKDNPDAHVTRFFFLMSDAPNIVTQENEIDTAAIATRRRECVIMIINRNYHVSTWFRRRGASSFFFSFFIWLAGRPDDAGFGLWVVKSPTGGRRTHRGIQERSSGRDDGKIVMWSRRKNDASLNSCLVQFELEFTQLNYNYHRFRFKDLSED